MFTTILAGIKLEARGYQSTCHTVKSSHGHLVTRLTRHSQHVTSENIQYTTKPSSTDGMSAVSDRPSLTSASYHCNGVVLVPCDHL